MNELTQRLKDRLSKRQEEWRREWNRIDLPILCFTTGLIILFLTSLNGDANFYIRLFLSITVSIGFYILFYDRGNK